MIPFYNPDIRLRPPGTVSTTIRCAALSALISHQSGAWSNFQRSRPRIKWYGHSECIIVVGHERSCSKIGGTRISVNGFDAESIGDFFSHYFFAIP
jgi:hypothetical protein